MKIIVTGGTGFIGRALVDEMVRLGHELVVLTRKADRYSRPSVRFVEWDAHSSGPWQAEFLSADAVVNLAGGTDRRRAMDGVPEASAAHEPDSRHQARGGGIGRACYRAPRADQRVRHRLLRCERRSSAG